MIDITPRKKQHLLSEICFPNHPKDENGYIITLPVFTRTCPKCGTIHDTVEYYDECLFCGKGVPVYRGKICLHCHGEFTSWNGQDYCGSCTFYAKNPMMARHK